jgi:phosphoribosylanthranilate isomerase
MDTGSVRVKICGVTTPADVLRAAECGADAVGLNFVPSSPRYLDPRRAADVMAALPPFVDAVGVFAGVPLRQACAVAYQLGLGGVQWYGGEALGPGAAFPFRLLAAFRVRDAASLEEITRFVAAARPSAVLVDAHVEGQLGGTGKQAPWGLLANFRPGVPMILAGGLTPANVADAVRTVRPFGVDVASGVESAPGVKDPAKVRDFVQAAKGASRGLEAER